MWFKKAKKSEVIKEAYRIALSTLRNNYSTNGINAGNTHFSDLWARDSCFACWGSIEVKDFDTVKNNLTSLLRNRHASGQLPIRIGTKHFLLKYIGVSQLPESRYLEDKYISTPTDQNSLFIISLERYLKASHDTEFCLAHFDAIKEIMDWNFTQDPDNDMLIEEGPYANWADSLDKSGKVLYTNVLHFEALKRFAEICFHLRKKDLGNTYMLLAKDVFHRLNSIFWTGNFYLDWIGKEAHHFFASDGNLLAIIFGVANKEKRLRIIESMNRFRINQGFCPATNHPKYPISRVYTPYRFINLHDYHNGMKWLWIGCIQVSALHLAGHTQQAMDSLEKISKKILEYKGIYEVYFHGVPVKRLFYHSEKGFAWSAGLFVWACHVTRAMNLEE